MCFVSDIVQYIFQDGVGGGNELFDAQLNIPNSVSDSQLNFQNTVTDAQLGLQNSVKTEPDLTYEVLNQNLSLEEQLGLSQGSSSVLCNDVNLLTGATDNTSIETLEQLLSVNKQPVVNISHPLNSSNQLQQAAAKLQRQAALVAQQKKLLQLQQQKQKQQQAQLVQQQLKLILQQATGQSSVQQTQPIQPKVEPQIITQSQIQQVVQQQQQQQQQASQINLQNVGQINLQQLQQVVYIYI